MSVFFIGATLAKAQTKDLGDSYSFPQVHCAPHERPTGCRYPFKQCFIGRFQPGMPREKAHIIPPQQSCKVAAMKHECDDFTWEKCCADTCRQDFGPEANSDSANQALRAGQSDLCMARCNAAPEALVYIPHAISKITKAEH